MEQPMSVFTSSEVVRITHYTYRQLDYRIRTGLIKPSKDANGYGSRREFVYRDLVAVRAIATLQAAGVSLQAIRKVQSVLRAFKGDDTELREGRLVIEMDRKRPDVGVALGDDVLSLLRSPGQSVLRAVFEMRAVYAVVDEGIEKVVAARARAAARKERAAA